MEKVASGFLSGEYPVKKIKEYFTRYHQMVINLILFLCIGNYIYQQTYFYKIFEELKIIDITFFIHNIIFLVVILIRKEYKEVDKDWKHWLVALGAFYSNFFFLNQNATGFGLVITIAEIINLFSIILGSLALISLGRSFGILPAVRNIKTGGVYNYVRHPMYLSDILFKTPILMKYFGWRNLFVYMISIILYVTRATYEEKLLTKYQEYRDYMQKVKYRFVPYLY